MQSRNSTLCENSPVAHAPTFTNWLGGPPYRNIPASALQREKRRTRQERPMSWKASGLCFVTMVLAGGFALAAIGDAAAETATNKCALEWKAAKANGTTGGKSWKEFFDQCGADQNGLSRSISLTPSDPKPAPAAATPAVATTPAAAATVPPAAAAPAAPTAKAEPTDKAVATPQFFATEAQAKAKCPTDEVVWLNAATKTFHLAGHASYGKSEKGGYVCEADATAAGAHAAKNEKLKKRLEGLKGCASLR
jgi:hypothetical protein